MSEQSPESDKDHQGTDQTSESHDGTDRETAESYVEKSIRGSGQSIGLEPGENFVAPTMALDSIEPESPDSE